jgi:hypothetical protein
MGFNCHLQWLNMRLILHTFQGYKWAHVSATTRRSLIMCLLYGYLNFDSHLLTGCSIIICYLSSEQSLKDCSSDFTGTFFFNILHV